MKNPNKKWKRFFMFILTLAFTVTTLSFSLADCGLTAYADYGLNPGIIRFLSSAECRSRESETRYRFLPPFSRSTKSSLIKSEN